jgi:predicted O-methyltransferase YrrM
MKLPWRKMYPGPSIDSSLTGKEIAELCKLASGKQIVEIGSAYGYACISMALAGGIVYTIDHHKHMNSETGLRQNINAYRMSQYITPLVGDSKKLLPTLNAGAFDLAFIDGDHSFAGVTFDAEQCWRLVREGGYLAFHDFGEDTCPEVKPAVQAFLESRQRVGTGNSYLVDTLLVVQR